MTNLTIFTLHTYHLLSTKFINVNFELCYYFLTYEDWLQRLELFSLLHKSDRGDRNLCALNNSVCHFVKVGSYFYVLVQHAGAAMILIFDDNVVGKL